MVYFKREIEATINRFLAIFPAIALTGPRQSGKSTTLKQVFYPNYEYLTFDDPLLVEFFHNDPEGFIKKYNSKIIFDEIQKAPGLFNYLKMIIDENRQDYGNFILTGSSNFSFIKEITESLAGRIGLLSFLPFQLTEIPEDLRDKQILYGSYPELVTRNYAGTREWYGAYINSYIERDVRSLYNIGNLRDFLRLLSLLAARISQELNLSSLAREIGVSVKTIQAWISVLEASYILFTLPPYHKNLGKRIVKRPKIYFYDTGLVCYLTGISSEEVLNKGPLAGAIFESYIISEVRKNILHNNSNSDIFYYRNNQGLEADLIIENKDKLTIAFIEIKNTYTAKQRMFASLLKMIELEKNSNQVIPMKKETILVYRGISKLFSMDANALNFAEFLGEKIN